MASHVSIDLLQPITEPQPVHQEKPPQLLTRYLSDNYDKGNHDQIIEDYDANNDKYY